jgi:hypothetical protein
MAGFLEAIMIAHIDARGRPVRELWRIFGPVYLVVHFVSPSSLRNLQNNKSWVGKCVHVVRRVAPTVAAYLMAAWNLSSFSLLTLLMLTLEKGLLEIDSLSQKASAAACASLMVRSVMGVHVGASWPFYIGTALTAYRRCTLYSAIGIYVNTAVMHLQRIPINNNYYSILLERFASS